MHNQLNSKKSLLFITLLFVSLLTVLSTANSATSPFAQNDSQTSKAIKGDNKKCGEGKCGDKQTDTEETKDKKCGEGKCGDKQAGTEETKDKKCGEGKCG